MFRKNIVISFLFLTVGSVCAQTYFGKQNVMIQSEANSATSVYASDIDGDGDADILSASYLDDKIAWYENTDGKGTFRAQQIITTLAHLARSVLACDIDGDGDQDVLSAGFRLTWYENTDGNGTFGEPQIISNSEPYPHSVYACDIDGDGDQDVLSASYEMENIEWYENTDGKGTFGARHFIARCPDVACSVHAGDIDGDGDQDVISASSPYNNDKIVWYKNTDGKGTFGAAQVVATGVPDEVYTCDIDGDEDIDVLSCYGRNIVWYENIDGNGTFGAQHITTLVSAAKSVYTCDIDGDGDTDLLTASSRDDKIAWCQNTDGKGTFGEQQIITNLAAGATSVFACDLDGDKDPDVISASFEDDKIAWYENTDGNGTFGEQQVLVTISGGRAMSVYACDMDGDEDSDVLSASEDEDKIAWYENTDGKGNFGGQQVITTLVDGARSAYACDIDGDGDMDVLSVSSGEKKIAWYQNTDGKGTFGEQHIITNLAGAGSVFTSDLDGDGDPDVLSASNGKIAWYENTDGKGNFGAQQVISLLGASSYACDLDGDGDPDVLSASKSEETIAWYENTDGEGTFGAEQVIAASVYNPKSINACDIDGDGDYDVLSGSRDSHKIGWYENVTGNGTLWAEHLIETSGVDHSSINACDIDGDGDQDVLSGMLSGFGGEISWYENTDGKGSYVERQINTDYVNGVQSIYVCDIDGDEDPDLLSACYDDDKLAWYENFTVKILTQPSIEKKICAGSDVEISLSAHDVENYQWQVDDGTGFTDLSNNIMYSGVTTDTLSIKSPDYLLDGYRYRCILSNAGGGIISDSVVLEFNNTTPVIISSYEDQTITAGNACETALPDYTGGVMATDSCDNFLDVTQDPIAGTTISGQTNNVTLTVTNDMGNTDEVTFNVAVEDNTNPTISCTGNKSVNADETHYYTVSGTELDPTETSDNCGIAGFINNFTNTSTLAGVKIPESTTTITWTITDNAGNENTCSFDVNVMVYTVGIEELQGKGISIYPNPTAGFVNCEFTNNHVQQLVISDIIGNQILEKTDVQQNETINLFGYESGVYIISIQINKDIYTLKILKE